MKQELNDQALQATAGGFSRPLPKHPDVERSENMVIRYCPLHGQVEVPDYAGYCSKCGKALTDQP